MTPLVVKIALPPNKWSQQSLLYNKEMHGTVLISLNQPTEELLELCDRCCLEYLLMAEKLLVFQGGYS